MNRIIIKILCRSIAIAFFNLSNLNAQTKDSVSGQPLTIYSDANEETDLAYVLPHKASFY